MARTKVDLETMLEGHDVSSASDMAAVRATYEEALDTLLASMGEEFLTAVISDAVEAYAGPGLTAAGERDALGKFVADPFSFTQVMNRWYGAVRELADLTDLNEGQVRLVMDGADLPSWAFDEVTEVLGQASEEGWTRYRTKRHLSRVLIPKESSGRWDSRARYRASIRMMARTLATENYSIRMSNTLDTMGFPFKEWVSRHDERVRLSHVLADGQTVRLQDRFSVGLAMLMYPGDPTAPIEEIANCRCVLIGAGDPTEGTDMGPKMNGGSTDFRAARVDQYSQVTLAEEEQEAVDEAAEQVAEEIEAEPVEDGPELVLWHGVIGMEQTMTGDGRMIEDGALRWDLPVPLRYAPSDVGGHGGAEVVGTIQHVEREAETGKIEATGTFDMSSEVGREAARQVGEGLTRGVSMDLDDVSFEVRVAEDVLAAHEAMLDGDGEEQEARAVVEGKVVMLTMSSDDEVHVTTSARIRAATIVAIPAFAEAQLDLVDDTDSVDDVEAIAQLSIEDAVGLADAEETYNWVDEVGGLPDYIRRIADHLIKQGMTESHAIASAVNTVKRWARGGTVTAGPGGPKVSAKTVAKAAAAVAEWEAKKIRAKASAGDTSQLALVAAGGPIAPPSGWFEDPRLTETTALRIGKDGRVYGHLAVWDSCHISHPEECTSPPQSATGYAYFHTGAVLTSDGEEVSVGHLTMNTGHADGQKGAMQALAHYDHTGSVGADVRAGEDQFGIWVAGAMRPGLSEEQVRSMRSAPLSGDWRRVGGNLELVAALAVNVPGFPVPRPSGRRSSGHTVALVASGMVAPKKVRRPGTEGALSAEDLRYLRSLARREKRHQADAMARRIREEKVRSFAAKL